MSKDKNKNQLLKYSSLCFQMFATIFVFFYIGFYLDNLYENEPKLITALTSIIGVIASFLFLFYKLKKQN